LELKKKSQAKGKEHMKALQEFTDEQLLFELITRNTVGITPSNREYHADDWLDCLIRIGSGSFANIRFTQDDFDALTVLAKEKDT